MSTVGWTIATVLAFVTTWVLDVFVANQGALATIIGFGGGLYTLVRLGQAVWRRQQRLVLARAGAAVVWFALPVSVLDTNRWLNARAAERAAEVVRAVDAYEHDQGSYPRSLSALVPRYLPEVPQAKPTVMGDFRYIPPARGRAPTLLYVELPPFGRRAYHFDERVWFTID